MISREIGYYEVRNVPFLKEWLLNLKYDGRHSKREKKSPTHWNLNDLLGIVLAELKPYGLLRLRPIHTL